MVSVLVTLLVHSALLFLFTAALFWGVVGSAAARRTGRSRVWGALVGAVLPGIGAPLMLLPGATGRARAAARLRAASLPGPGVFPVPPAWAGGPSVAPALRTWAGGPNAFPATGVPWCAGSPPSVGSPITGGSYVRTPPPPARPVVTGAAALRAAPAVLAALLLVGAATEPWFVLHTPVVDAAGLLSSQSGVTVVPVLLASTAVAALAVLQVLWPRGTWPVLAAAVGATALLVSLQLLLVTDALSDVLRLFGSRVPHGSGLRPARGAFLLLAGGALSLAWAALSVAACPPVEVEP